MLGKNLTSIFSAMMLLSYLNKINLNLIIYIS